MATHPNSERLIVVGALAGAHGVRGDVRVKSFTDEPEGLFSLGSLLDKDGKVLLEAAKARPANDYFIVTPVAPRQKEEWDALKGTRLHVKRSSLPPPEDDEFYIEDLSGLDAVDTQGAPVGTVKSVQNFGAGDLLEIQPLEAPKRGFFVPFTLKDVPEVNFRSGRVTIRDAAAWADQSGSPQEEQES